MEKRIRVKYVKVRMEDDLYAALQHQAKKDKRSMVRQVEIYIEKGLRAESNNQEWDGVERRKDGQRKVQGAGGERQDH